MAKAQPADLHQAAAEVRAESGRAETYPGPVGQRPADGPEGEGHQRPAGEPGERVVQGGGELQPKDEQPERRQQRERTGVRKAEGAGVQVDAVDAQPEKQGGEQELRLPPGLTDQRQVQGHRHEAGRGGRERMAGRGAEHTGEPARLEEDEIDQGGHTVAGCHHVLATGSPIRASTSR